MAIKLDIYICLLYLLINLKVPGANYSNRRFYLIFYNKNINQYLSVDWVQRINDISLYTNKLGYIEIPNVNY